MGRSRRLAVDDGTWAYRFEFFNDPVAPTVIGGFRNLADYVEVDTSGSGDDPQYVDADRISPPHVVAWAKGLVSFEAVTERQAIFMAVANANTQFELFPGIAYHVGYSDPAAYDTISIGARQDVRTSGPNGKFKYFESSLTIEFKDTITFNFSRTATFIEGGFVPVSLPSRPANALFFGGFSTDDVMVGSATSQTIFGDGGNDTITVNAPGCDAYGDTGNDTILGAQAACNLFGGDDDDTITAGQANYVDGGSGNDTIITSGPTTTIGYYDGGAGFDRAVIDFSGLASAITFTLRADGGNAHLVQSGFATFAFINIEEMIIIGGSGADKLTGSDTVDTLDGSGGADILNGGTGADTMIGGADNDLYVVDNIGDTIVETQGGGSGDQVLASVSFALAADDDIEVLTTTTRTGTGAIDLTGNDLTQSINGNAGVNVLKGRGGADVLSGFAGADKIDGGTGADTMIGGADNDLYVVDNLGDIIVESSGEGTADQVLASISFALVSNDDIEILTTTSRTGTGAINLTGNDLAQAINGNAGVNVLKGRGGVDVLNGFIGADTLDGGTGADTMIGGADSDLYVVDNTGDTIVEIAGGGTADQVLASISFALVFDDNIEMLTTTSRTGTGALDLTGNDLAQVINGNAGVNVLKGLGGGDVLSGFAGADTLDGGADADVLLGGDGADTLTGGSAADQFRFESLLAANADTITDFVSGTDRIGLAAAAFGLPIGALDPARFSGTGAATAATGQFVYSAASHTLSWDADGTGGGAAVLLATLNASAGLTLADLFVF